MKEKNREMPKSVAATESSLKLAVTEQPLNIRSESQSSVEINMSVKGVVGYTVKAYADDPAEARKMAVKEFKALQKEFK